MKAADGDVDAFLRPLSGPNIIEDREMPERPAASALISATQRDESPSRRKGPSRPPARFLLAYDDGVSVKSRQLVVGVMVLTDLATGTPLRAMCPPDAELETAAALLTSVSWQCPQGVGVPFLVDVDLSTAATAALLQAVASDPNMMLRQAVAARPRRSRREAISTDIVAHGRHDRPEGRRSPAEQGPTPMLH